MFQSFDVTSDPAASAARVRALRDEFDALGIDAFVVPHGDEHGSEYPPPSAARLEWLSGFTGSAGVALVTRDGAHILSDGRYTLQLERQTDGEVWTRHPSHETPLTELLPTLGALRVGIDPWLHTIAGARALTKAAEKAGGSLVRLARNPIDAVWPDRPPKPREGVTLHRAEHAGRPAKDKLADMAEAMREAGAKAHVVTDPLSLAWMLNLRGRDVAHNPVPLVWAVLHEGRRPTVHVTESRLGLSARAYLTQLADIAPEADLPRAVAAAAEEGPVMLDPGRAADALRGIVEWAGGTVVEATDPALLPRAIKNETEIAGARAAHRRDGAAMVGFLRWLDAREAGTVTEIEAAQRLERARVETGERLGEPLRDLSFETISGSGPNGAIVHYRVTTASDRTLGSGELYLVDSGGQYFDGTTDVTRTVAIGTPTDAMREHFTLVLKGMIAVSRLRFPAKIEGRHIDVVARRALWERGLDYAHGTGHGVGSYGAVHEGPQGISRRSVAAFEPGMIVSNEPGYYREGQYGIRIENLVLVHEARQIEGGEVPMMGFDTLTLVPVDRRLVEGSLLEADERAWLDAYHARVLDEIGPLLADESERAWLRAACAPLDGSSRKNGRPSDETVAGGAVIASAMAERRNGADAEFDEDTAKRAPGRPAPVDDVTMEGAPPAIGAATGKGAAGPSDPSGPNGPSGSNGPSADRA